MNTTTCLRCSPSAFRGRGALRESQRVGRCGLYVENTNKQHSYLGYLWRGSALGLLVLTLSWSSVAFGATYYVSNSGDDSAAGTSAAPFRTFQRAVDTVGPGDTVILRSGTYAPVRIPALHGAGSRHTSAAACPRVITFKSADGEEAVIDHQACEGDSSCKSNLHVRSLEFIDVSSCLVFDGLTLTNSDPGIDELRRCDVVNDTKHCVGVWRAKVGSRGAVRMCSNSSCSENAHSITDRVRSSHLVFRNLTVHHHPYTAIMGAVDYLQILDSKIYDIGAIGEGYGTYVEGKGTV
ncbi:MAG: DUF1565 domain-containing protein [Myxococcota bacterium]